MKKILSIPLIFLAYAALSLCRPGTILGLDEIYKLYICHTEHILLKILDWENSNPGLYKKATKNGELTPFEAAKKIAGRDIGEDVLQCSADRQVIIADINGKGKSSSKSPTLLSQKELADYCPRTVKQYVKLCD